MENEVHVSLVTSFEQSHLLRHAQQTVNAACFSLYRWACRTRTVGPYALVERMRRMREARCLPEPFLLPCVFAVAAACLEREQQAHEKQMPGDYLYLPNMLSFVNSLVLPENVFAPNAPIVYEDSLLGWDFFHNRVALWTPRGWLDLPFACADSQRTMLTDDKTQTCLRSVGSLFHLTIVCGQPTSRSVSRDISC